MSYRHWFTAIAFGLNIAFFGASYAQAPAKQPEPNHADRQGQNGGAQNNAAQFSVPVPILEEPEETNDAKRQQRDATQREIDDLAAQQSVAKSTEELVWLTKLQFVLGFAGTGVLLYTLYLNWKSADAAIKAVQSERAWIIAAGFDIGSIHGGLVDSRTTNDGLAIIPKWKNSGRSPSLDTECYAEHKLISHDEDIPYFELKPAEGEMRRSAVGPETQFFAPIRAINDEDTAALRDGRVRMIIYSMVKYADIFDRDRTHYSEVCVQVQINGEEEINGVRRPHISFMPVGQQNTLS